MNGMQKVLVVDNGEREPDSALSAELAGMGYASVTTSYEAADDVLAVIPNPTAVVLQMSQHADWSERRRFLELAHRLRRTLSPSGVPVLIAGGTSGALTMLQNELGSQAVAGPDL
ncbi:hypothetical protein [Microvirga puerhi]|uniref:Response regulatory domain-containing protein n=1 Tax=Microvirga puerhi TaxID=2876078 RepID=A0ABS7VHW6_9HYPH|nr:hypothetical protein [Microvirga puerhi]MBZ6075092.1 hypothetical protein [Microvirga puerhi]